MVETVVNTPYTVIYDLKPMLAPSKICQNTDFLRAMFFLVRVFSGPYFHASGQAIGGKNSNSLEKLQKRIHNHIKHLNHLSLFSQIATS